MERRKFLKNTLAGLPLLLIPPSILENIKSQPRGNCSDSSAAGQHWLVFRILQVWQEVLRSRFFLPSPGFGFLESSRLRLRAQNLFAISLKSFIKGFKKSKLEKFGSSPRSTALGGSATPWGQEEDFLPAFRQRSDGSQIPSGHGQTPNIKIIVNMT